jgi:hypothetical protein
MKPSTIPAYSRTRSIPAAETEILELNGDACRIVRRRIKRAGGVGRSVTRRRRERRPRSSSLVVTRRASPSSRNACTCRDVLGGTSIGLAIRARITRFRKRRWSVRFSIRGQRATQGRREASPQIHSSDDA